MTGHNSSGCAVKWCEEAGWHAVHRSYAESLPGGTRESGMVGVNVAQRNQPRAPICVEVTVTTAWDITTGNVFAPVCAVDIGKAIVAVAKRARHIQTGGNDNDEPEPS